jgi:GNAT superfamily N-acetyltransferase
VLTAASAGEIRKASAEDAPGLADALARAFQNDPGWSHLLPDASDRTQRLRMFFQTELLGVLLPMGVVWTTDEAVGAAVWMPPDSWRVPVTATLREVAPMEGRHPRKPPHWYLAIMGVVPEWQGRGLGTALMLPGLQALDVEGLPAYLESSTPRSRALYERNGFAVTGEFNLPSDGPPLWQMWREPAS